MSKERPILFSTPMVQALLAGRKSQTRRVVKPQPNARATEIVYREAGWPGTPWHARLELPKTPRHYEVTNTYKCPYGQIGDILWVREAFCFGSEDCFHTFYYRASDRVDIQVDGDGFTVFNKDGSERSPWKPSIHMPKAASRIWLEITDIRVERVGEISEPDAVAEGIEDLTDGQNLSFKDYMKGRHPLTAVASYKSLWESINGPESWEVSPWVWTVEFRILSTTGKPSNL